MSGTTYNFQSSVAGFVGDAVAATVGATAYGSGNTATQSASTVVTQTAGTSNALTIGYNARLYNGLVTGAINETYTVTVVTGSTGGNPTTAVLSITSASGTDNVGLITPAALETLFNVGTRGLQLKIHSTAGTPDLVVGQTWTVAVAQAFTATVASGAGTYTGTANDTYIAQVTRGGLLADSNPLKTPQIRVTTVGGLDVSGPTTITAAATAYAIGVNGVTISLAGGTTGLNLGDKFYIPVTAATTGRIGTLVLNSNMPSQLAGASDLNLKLYAQRSFNVDFRRLGYEPLVNWTQDPVAGITINSGLIAYDPGFLDNSGNKLPLPVEDGQFTVQYRAWQPTLVQQLGTISDISTIDTVISGALTPDNPLKWGVYKALTNSNGTDVKFTAVANPVDPNSWLPVLSVINGRDDVYGLVPLTHDQTVLNAFVAHVNDQSSAAKGHRRVLWTHAIANPTLPVVSNASSSDGNTVLATITANPATPTLYHTLVTIPASNGKFVTNGVRPGDTVRYAFTTSYGIQSYASYTVASVINEDELALVSGPTADVTVAQKIEVWRNLTKDEQAANIATQAGAYGNSRVRVLWPDVVGSGGTLMKGSHLCAAYAGYRSGIVPQQSLTNLTISGFDDLTRTTSYFNSDQLDVMASGGVFIVTEDNSGNVYARQALTTLASDLTQRSEMFVSNFDSIAAYYKTALSPFIGRANVTPAFLAQLRVELGAIRTYLLTNGASNLLGGQMIDAVIADLRQHPTLLDRVIVVINLTLPLELNNIELHLVV